MGYLQRFLEISGRLFFGPFSLFRRDSFNKHEGGVVVKNSTKKNVQKEWGKTGSKGIIGIKERGEINSEGLGLPSTQIK